MRDQPNAGKRILVTGGNSGIGLALSRQLAVEEGCEVLLGARDSSRGEEAVASIRAELSGGAVGSVSLVVVDVAEDGSVVDAVADIDEPLFGLVNNAGTGLAHGVSPERVVETNLY